MRFVQIAVLLKMAASLKSVKSVSLDYGLEMGACVFYCFFSRYLLYTTIMTQFRGQHGQPKPRFPWKYLPSSPTLLYLYQGLLAATFSPTKLCCSFLVGSFPS